MISLFYDIDLSSSLLPSSSNSIKKVHSLQEDLDLIYYDDLNNFSLFGFDDNGFTRCFFPSVLHQFNLLGYLIDNSLNYNCFTIVKIILYYCINKKNRKVVESLRSDGGCFEWGNAKASHLISHCFNVNIYTFIEDCGRVTLDKYIINNNLHTIFIHYSTSSKCYSSLIIKLNQPTSQVFQITQLNDAQPKYEGQIEIAEPPVSIAVQLKECPPKENVIASTPRSAAVQENIGKSEKSDPAKDEESKTSLKYKAGVNANPKLVQAKKSVGKRIAIGLNEIDADEFTNFKEYNIASDGNCFYRAVEHQLKSIGYLIDNNKNYNYLTIKSILSSYCKDRKNQEVINMVKQFYGSETNSFINKIHRNGAWAGEAEALLIHHCFQVNIHLFSKYQDGTYLNTYSKDDNYDNIHISFNGVDHYSSLLFI